MDGKTLGTVVLVIIILGGGWYMLSQKPAVTPEATSNTTNTTTTTTTTSGPTVTYTDAGFSPKSLTVMVGTAVTFVNQGSKEMWVGSAQHPTHQVYSGTNLSVHCAAGYTGEKPFDQCQDGDTYTFVFDKVGTWNYHNHSGAQDFGTVIVTAAPTTTTASTSVNVSL